MSATQNDSLITAALLVYW